MNLRLPDNIRYYTNFIPSGQKRFSQVSNLSASVKTPVLMFSQADTMLVCAKKIRKRKKKEKPVDKTAEPIHASPPPPPLAAYAHRRRHR